MRPYERIFCLGLVCLRQNMPTIGHSGPVILVTSVFRLAAALLLAGPPLAAAPSAAPIAQGGSAATVDIAAGPKAVAPGVTFRTFRVPASRGSTRVYLVTADLNSPHVHAGLLYSGAVAARQTVLRMAEDQGVIAAVNGNFFDIDEGEHPGVPATGAPSGPAVIDGYPLEAAVPAAQQFGWQPLRGDAGEDVVGVGTDGVARVARLTLRGDIHTPDATLSLGGLNQYALPVGSIGLFTPLWGTASRARAVCGTDTNRAAPCSRDTYEVTVRNGRVAALSNAPGHGAIRANTIVLLGREAGADALRALPLGAPVQVDYSLEPSSGIPFAFALGAQPLLRAGRPVPGLDAATADPRTAVCIADGGHALTLLTTDGREGTSTGLTLTRLADLLSRLGCTDAANLDGGASTTLVTRNPFTGRLTVRNTLDHGQERPVPNGVAIFSR